MTKLSTAHSTTSKRVYAKTLGQQESLRAVIEVISSELELRPLLTTIVRYACELLQADRGTIGLVIKEKNVIRTEAAYQMPEGELGLEMLEGVGVAGQVLKTKKPVILNRYGDTSSPIYDGMLEDAVIGMPIFWHSEMIGFFGIGVIPPRHFNQEDSDTLALLARHAAIAIHNAQTFEAEKRRLARITTLSKIGQLITGSLSLETVLQTTLEAIYEQLHYDNVAFLLTDPKDPETLVLQARSGIYKHVAAYRQSIHEGIIGAAARSKQPLLISDVTKDPRYIPIPGTHVRSELALPMVVGDKLLGVLNIETETSLFEDDIPGLGIIATQLGIAVENARLFAETQRALEETQLLFETSQRMSMALDMDGVVEAYLAQVATRHRYRCTVATFETNEVNEKTAIVTLGRWVPKDGIDLEKATFPYFQDDFDKLLDAGQTVTITHVSEDPRVSETLRDAQVGRGYPALALIPLIVRGKRIGVVSLSDKERHDWTEVDLRPYQVTAAQLAIALNSRKQQQQLQEGEQRIAVFEERQRIARDLHDSVNQLIFSMTLIAQSLGSAYQRDPAEGDKRTQRLLELSHMVRTEMRSLLVETRHMADSSLATLQRDGLVKALQQHIREVTKAGITVTLEADHYGAQLAELEEGLFRISQEAFNNVQKHARASQVWLSLSSQADGVHLIIKDNGVGFIVPQAVARESAIGLKSMRERAEATGASFTIESMPGQGTRLEVWKAKS
jgi:signal transduction histidine kinase